MHFYKTCAAKAYNCTDGYNAKHASAKRKIARLFFKLVYPVINHETLYKKFESLCKKYNSTETEYVSMLSFAPMNKKFWIKKKNLDRVVDVSFEETSIKAPSNYVDILKQQYGDYTKLVKNGSYHGDVIFDVNAPYIK